MKTRRIGRFKVAGQFFHDLDVLEGMNLFNNMVVLRAAPLVATDHVEYVAVHMQFDEVPEGSEIPEYCATFNNSEIFPHWVRLN